MLLKDCSTIFRGSSPRPINNYISKSGVPWLKISDFNLGDRFVSKTSEYIIKDGLSHTKYVKKGSLVVTNSGTPGIPIFLGSDMCLHDGFLYFDKINDCLLPLYLYYYILSKRNYLLSQGSGSIFINLKKEILENLNIDLPSLPTQQHIVDTIILLYFIYYFSVFNISFYIIIKIFTCYF